MAYFQIGKFTVFRPDAWGTGSTSADAKLLKLADRLIAHMQNYQASSLLGARLDAVLRCWLEYKKFAESVEGRAANAHANNVERNMLDFVSAFRVWLHGIDLPGILSLPKSKIEYTAEVSP